MHTTQAMLETSRGRRLARMMAPAVFALLIVGHAQVSHAQTQTGQPKAFSSAGEASQALFQAVQSHDEPALEAILGAGKEVTSTGDDAADKLEHEKFAQKYQEMHRLVREPDGTTVLYIGAENWPFPVPLTSRNGKWSFDAKTGMEEMLFRRIGENEATTLDVCRGLVSAAQHAPPENQALHGYYFRTLGQQPAKLRRAKVQAAETATVSEDRVSGGKIIGGAAFVAYPAEYRSSGVMTFIVAKDGTVYERDLGPDTATLAPAIKDRKPRSAWHVVKASDDAGPAPSSSH